MSERTHVVKPSAVLAAACAIAISGLSSSCAKPKIMPQAERPIWTTNTMAPAYEHRLPEQPASPEAAPAPQPPTADPGAPVETGPLDAGTGGDAT